MSEESSRGAKRDPARHRRSPLTRRFVHKVAFVLAAVAFVALALLPIFLVPDQESADAPGDIERISLVALSGPGVLVALAIPVVLAGLPLLLRGRITAIVTAVLLFAFAIFTLLGIGVFYLPAALAAIVALFLRDE